MGVIVVENVKENSTIEGILVNVYESEEIEYVVNWSIVMFYVVSRYDNRDACIFSIDLRTLLEVRYGEEGVHDEEVKVCGKEIGWVTMLRNDDIKGISVIFEHYKLGKTFSFVIYDYMIESVLKSVCKYLSLKVEDVLKVVKK